MSASQELTANDRIPGSGEATVQVGHWSGKFTMLEEYAARTSPMPIASLVEEVVMDNCPIALGTAHRITVLSWDPKERVLVADICATS